MDARRDLEETMSKGTVTLLVIVFVVCISCGAGYAAYRIVREKLRRLSRMAFGTDSITEGLETTGKRLLAGNTEIRFCDDTDFSAADPEGFS